MKNVIYKIEDQKGRIYIGSAYDFNVRKNSHLRDLNKNRHISRKLQNVVNKHGIDFIRFEIVEKVESRELLIEREQFYIDTFHPWFNTYLTAGSSFGYKHSAEVKRAHSERRKGKPIHSEEFKAALAERNKNRVWSEESKKKSSDSKKGHTVTEEWVNAIKKANTGRSFTDDHKKKIGDANRGMIINEATRMAVAESNKRRAKKN